MIPILGTYTARVQKINGQLTMTVCRNYPFDNEFIIKNAEQVAEEDYRRLNVGKQIVTERELEKGEFICYASRNVLAGDGTWYKRRDMS